MKTKNMMEVSNEEARLLEQLRANPQIGEHLRAVLQCAMSEHMGEAGADEAEERIVKHTKALGLAVLTGWARQADEQCARQLRLSEPDARQRAKKK
jgi:hypothetical protein